MPRRFPLRDCKKERTRQTERETNMERAPRTRTIYQDKHLTAEMTALPIRCMAGGVIKVQKPLISTCRNENNIAWMQGNGDGGTAGGGRWLARLTGGMRKREIESICRGSCLLSLLVSPIRQINSLPLSNQPTSLPHLCALPRCAAPLFSMCCLLF